MADQRPIHSIENEHLQSRTELRLRPCRRTLRRLAAVREAMQAIGQLENLANLSTPDTQSRSCLRMLRRLDEIMCTLNYNLGQIWEEQEADEAMERQLWAEVNC